MIELTEREKEFAEMIESHVIAKVQKGIAIVISTVLSIVALAISIISKI